jgi:Uma2 family endonuclease
MPEPMTMEKTTKRTYTIQIPIAYPLSQKKLDELRKWNSELELNIEEGNVLEITESAFLFEDYGYFGIKLPGLTYKMFEELELLNEETNFEFDDKEEVFIKMAIFALIGAFTAFVGASFVLWARSQNRGRVYSDPTGYKLDDPKRPGKKIRRIPDLSYITYESVPEEEQDTWESFIPIHPDMALEIVSAKYGTKLDLKKMETFWMPSGVSIGLVLCKFTEQVYIFEKGVKGYRTQSIYETFTHPLLPGYEENFGKYLKKKGGIPPN